MYISCKDFYLTAQRPVSLWNVRYFLNWPTSLLLFVYFRCYNGGISLPCMPVTIGLVCFKTFCRHSLQRTRLPEVTSYYNDNAPPRFDTHGSRSAAASLTAVVQRLFFRDPDKTDTLNRVLLMPFAVSHLLVASRELSSKLRRAFHQNTELCWQLLRRFAPQVFCCWFCPQQAARITYTTFRLRPETLQWFHTGRQRCRY